MPQHQVALHFRPAEIEMAVLEAQLLGRELFTLAARDGNRWRDGRSQDDEPGGLYLDVSGRELGVLHARRPRGDLALDLDHRLAPQSGRHAPHLVGRSRADRDLHQARAVAQIDEEDAPEVAPAVHPAAQPHPLPDMLRAQLAAAQGTSGCAADAGYGTSASHSTR